MLFAFLGEIGHGKSTCATTLVPYGFTLVNFADPVKAVCKIVFGLTDHELEDHVLKRLKLDRWPWITPRECMWLVGTDMFREWDDETWLHAYERNVDNAPPRQRLRDDGEGMRLSTSHDVVTSDVRFPNEAAKVRARGGVIVRVIDPRKPLGVEGHAAEQGHLIIEPDITLLNDAGLEDIQAKVRQLAQV